MWIEFFEFVIDIFNEFLFLNFVIIIVDKFLIFIDWVFVGIIWIRDICYEVILGFLFMLVIYDFLMEDIVCIVFRIIEEWKEFLVVYFL